MPWIELESRPCPMRERLSTGCPSSTPFSSRGIVASSLSAARAVIPRPVDRCDREREGIGTSIVSPWRPECYMRVHTLILTVEYLGYRSPRLHREVSGGTFMSAPSWRAPELPYSSSRLVITTRRLTASSRQRPAWPHPPGPRVADRAESRTSGRPKEDDPPRRALLTYSPRVRAGLCAAARP